MSIITSVPPPLPSTAKLVKTTLLAAAVAGVLLVTVVMPAEYGIDPTGLGARLGLTALAAIDAEPDDVAPIAIADTAQAPDVLARNQAEAAKAAQVFGANAKQTFAAEAVSAKGQSVEPRSESIQITLEPGKGAEAKMPLAAGDGIVYRWVADGDVAVDMHGERVDVKGPWTTYSVEAAQRGDAGTFVAPFEGTHGWYWKNRSSAAVTIHVEVTGFQESLYQP